MSAWPIFIGPLASLALSAVLLQARGFRLRALLPCVGQREQAAEDG